MDFAYIQIHVLLTVMVTVAYTVLHHETPADNAGCRTTHLRRPNQATKGGRLKRGWP